MKAFSMGSFRPFKCRIRLVLVAVLLLAASWQSPATRGQAFRTEVGHAEVTSRVPLHTFTGRSDHLVGLISLPDSTVDFYLDLTTLKSGIGKRDKDMRKSLDTDEFPFAEFFGKLTGPFNPEQTGPQIAVVRGTFTIHGVSRNVEIEGSLEKVPEGIRLRAEWKLNLEDHDIVPPRLLIVRVDKIQEIRIDALLAPLDR